MHDHVNQGVTLIPLNISKYPMHGTQFLAVSNRTMCIGAFSMNEFSVCVRDRVIFFTTRFLVFASLSLSIIKKKQTCFFVKHRCVAIRKKLVVKLIKNCNIK